LQEKSDHFLPTRITSAQDGTLEINIVISRYRAPEIILKSKTYSSPVDIWACGCIFAELVTLQPLFPGSGELDQLLKICALLGPPKQQAVPTNNERTRKSYSNCYFKPVRDSNFVYIFII